ncbi:mucin-22 isoform X1 [Amia ocellicauda]|uniref:mucin-22 isoform X1 n=2 Tax=Amia ocellicauda TaxID=2972642 RepID=UPI003463F2DF
MSHLSQCVSSVAIPPTMHVPIHSLRLLQNLPVVRMRASEAAQLTVLLTVTLSTLAPPITANVSNVNVTPRTANMTMTTAAMETRLEIQAALMELFSANLTNQSTADFKDETQYFTAEIENIFKNSKFKESFLYTEVITFSSHLSRAFLVDFDLVFNSSYPVPHINSAITELMVAIYSNQTALPLNPCFFEHRGVTTVVPPTTLTPVSTPPMATGNTTKGSTTTISTPPGATAAGDTTKGTGTTATTPPGATAAGDTTKGTGTTATTPPGATAAGDTTKGTGTTATTLPGATAAGDTTKGTGTTATTPPGATAAGDTTKGTGTTATTLPGATAAGDTTKGTGTTDTTPPGATAAGDTTKGTGTTATTLPGATAAGDTTKGTGTTDTTLPGATAAGDTTKGTGTTDTTPPGATAAGDTTKGTGTTATTLPGATAAGDTTKGTGTTDTTPPGATAAGDTTKGTGTTATTPPGATAAGDTTKGTGTTATTPPGATAAGDTTKGTGTTATTPPGATATGDTTKGTAPTTASMAPSFTTTAAATSTTNTILTTPVPQNTVILFFSILWDFTLALNDRNSQEFIKLAQEVTSECNTIFQARFGSIFISTFLAKFSNGSIITALDMEFTSRSSIPPDNDIIQTFRKAAQDQSFSFPINPNIIYISRNVTTSQNTTGAAAPLSPSSPFPAMLFSLLATLLSARLFLR